MTTLKLSPETLAWAAGQVGRTLHEVAKTVAAGKVDKIVAGTLTTSEAISFAKKTRVPFGYLFLAGPPESRKLPVADFRTLPDKEPLGQDFFHVFDDILLKQVWFRDYLLSEQADALPFVGKFSAKKAKRSDVAADIRSQLKLTDANISAHRTAEELFNFIAGKAEEAGVLVFRNGVVGNNTTRPLSAKEFRGFAITDKLAPIVFINGADTPAATVFTLVHELAHIWLGESAVSDTLPSTKNDSERLCNAVAADVLLPQSNFIALWNASGTNGLDAIDFVRSRVKVSGVVVARSALDAKLIDVATYEKVYDAAKKAAQEKKAAAGSGGSFYATLPIRNSRRFTSQVSEMAVKGAISLREAGNLLNTNPNNVVTLYSKKHALPD